MFQSAATREGKASDWHLVHLGHLALGQPALVFTEVCAVEERGRVTYSDLGIWGDSHVEGLARLAAVIKTLGSVPAIQIGHAGRKASSRRPWDGLMQGLDESDLQRGEPPWETVGPSGLTFESTRPCPRALSVHEIDEIRDQFAKAARRADEAGFEALEIHGAHGYLLHQFLSSSSNLRTDGYGGALSNRMRLPLEVSEAVRSVWPRNKPVFFRISASDGADPGWSMEETLAFTRALIGTGVDVIDCSSGGIGVANMNIRGRSIPGFQVRLADQVRKSTGAKVMAVGLIQAAQEAEEIVASGKADLVAIGREMLLNPRWPLHAARSLGVDLEYQRWPVQYGWWLAQRDRSLSRTSDIARD